LHHERQLREVHHVTILPSNERALQEVGHALGVSLAILGQAVEVPDHLLEPRRSRAYLDDDVRLFLSCVPPVVRHPGRHVQASVQLRDRLVPGYAEAHPPAHHRERLLCDRVGVLSRNGATGLDV
jgi:hypothetical protein